MKLKTQTMNISMANSKIRFSYYFIILLLGGVLFTTHSNGESVASGHGVVLLYHHVSTETPASTSISPEKFSEHMAYLKQHHSVVPLKMLVENIQDGTPLPKDAVAITFDDGYQNILENAHPILKKYDFPYTVFINPDLIGKESHQLDWAQIKKMAKQGVSFANHTRIHKHLLIGNEQSDWLNTTMKNIKHAEQSIKDNSGFDLKYLAYPYGEYNESLSQAIVKNGFVGFGQHSGAISKHSDFGALPRFPAAGIYANLDTLKVKMNSLNMPVTNKSVNNPQRSRTNKKVSQSIQVNLDDMHKSQLACFFSGKAIDITWQENTFSYTLEKPLPSGRSRVNCTAPSIAHSGKYYWFSQPWFVPDENNNWPD